MTDQRYDNALAASAKLVTDAKNQILEDANIPYTWDTLVTIANDTTIAGKRENAAAVVMSAVNSVYNVHDRGISEAVEYERKRALALIGVLAKDILG